jgi:hypothetical protein
VSRWRRGAADREGGERPGGLCSEKTSGGRLLRLKRHAGTASDGCGQRQTGLPNACTNLRVSPQGLSTVQRAG